MNSKKVYYYKNIFYFTQTGKKILYINMIENIKIEDKGNHYYIKALKNIDFNEFEKIIKESKKEFLNIYKKYGIIIFSGFSINCIDNFYKFTNFWDFKKFGYDGGLANRTEIVKNVFTANEVNPDFEIGFHNEMSYLTNYPDSLIFYCNDFNCINGKTSLLSGEELTYELEKNKKAFIEKIKNKKIIYNQIIEQIQTDDSFINSWKNIFQIEEDINENNIEQIKKIVENKIKNQYGKKSNIRWDEKNNIILDIYMDGVIKYNEKDIYFNPVHVFYKDIQQGKQNIKLYYGDYTKVEGKDLKDLDNIINRIKFSIKWKENDIVMIDNKRILHSRESYKGKRNIYVSLFKENKN